MHCIDINTLVIYYDTVIFRVITMISKKSYVKPVLEYCGAVNDRTLGSGGSTPDGGGSMDQTGGGNDGRGPH